MTGKDGILSGKVSLITGSSSGIGAAAARVFAREGSAVVLTARREDRLAALVKELRQAGADAEYVVADVIRADDMRRAVEFTVERFGRLDAAFNNAGYAVGRTPLHLMDDEVYDPIMDTNVRGLFNCLRPEISTMLESGNGGAIVNTSSVGGLVASPVAAPYVASKHAVIGLTKAAAAEYGGQGIRVNAIAPGTTRSELVEEWYAQNPEIEKELHRTTPQPRTAEPEETAEAAAWLCSDRSSYVTGATLPVDGGFTAL
ncbi:glucose 1-dehydrogenase [Streptomyces sp. NBC_01525]|uniref:Glucose 1-dehydrogenase n=1 Tax=Streptomyces benahoarensis TaxID=2595054 RepID=A0A553ZQP5_9ACTN|nr:glucose 1-dehydrogenase [Streptomyces benahoarensis]TSB31837.1 glucose 1-dehydrogenase [Streptomyces benahoarensis]TSB43743.1 glucose 1-dehydrogenase [Streptomyces benahoarensis]